MLVKDDVSTNRPTIVERTLSGQCRFFIESMQTEGIDGSGSLKDFETLARVGSFSKAADLRNVTQPAFSRRVKSLEQWVGGRLFDRGAQPVTLTASGELFLAFVQEGLARLEEGRIEARRLAEDAPSACGSRPRIRFR
jgi:hypothetical protein